MKSRRSGPSGKHKNQRKLVTESEPGQFERWAKAAATEQRNLMGWIRWHLDRVAQKALKNADK